MQVTINLHARINPVEELVRNDGGIQAVPPGRVIVTLDDGTQFPLARGRFEALAPIAVLDPDSMTYLEGEDGEVEKAPTEIAPFDPTAHAPAPITRSEDQFPGSGPGEEQDADAFPTEGTVDDVLAWVGEDRERAQSAMEHEKTKGPKARTGLQQKLGKLLAE